MKASPNLLFTLIFAFSAAAFGQNITGIAPANYNDTGNGVRRHRPTADHAKTPASPAEELEKRAFDLLNSERASRGLEPLQWSDTVASVARLHSQNMASRNFFSHQGLDGLMVDDRAEKMGLVNWSAIGENIAFLTRRPNPAEFAIEQWMRSPAHRENLLGTRWKESAIGIAITQDGKYYFTQVFITR